MNKEVKNISGVNVARSSRWYNYGVSKCGRAFRWDTERELKVGLQTGGEYPVFRVSHEGKPSWVYIHYAIMECWEDNPNPELLVEVNHKNGIKTDYSFDNLEWVSRSQNQRHALDTNLKQSGVDLYNASLTETQVHLICQDLQSGMLPNDIGDKYNVSKHVVRKIRTGDTWVHIRSLYPIHHEYRNSFSETTVRWVCERIVEGYGDSAISKMSTNKKMVIAEVKRIRNKVRYCNISNEYF